MVLGMIIVAFIGVIAGTGYFIVYKKIMKGQKRISHMLGHSKEIISADVYGDTAEIIEDCLYAIEPFMEDVLPESREEEYYDYSDLKEIDEAVEEYLMAA